MRGPQSYRTDIGRLRENGSAAARRRRILTRAVPLVVIAMAAFVVGTVIAADTEAPTAQRFLEAWEQDDYAAMHAELTTQARSAYPLARFRSIYERAAETATLTGLSARELS